MKLQEFKNKSAELFKELDHINNKFESLSNSDLEYKEYAKKWDELWAKKMELQDKLEGLNDEVIELDQQ